jgi:hypothetical protein
MKLISLAAKALLVLSLLAPANWAISAPPNTAPPRGHAYGYYLKDGEKVMFIYLTDTGSRLIELWYCRPNRQYLIESSEDLNTWTPLATVRAAVNGTASCTDNRPLPHCFYRVTGAN